MNLQGSAFTGGGFRIPKHLIESAVQMIFTVIFFQRISFSVQRKLCPANTIGITPDRRPKRRGALLISRQRVISENYVADFSVAVGDLDGNYRAAEVADDHLHAGFIRERIQVRFAAIFGLPEHACLYPRGLRLCRGSPVTNY